MEPSALVFSTSHYADSDAINCIPEEITANPASTPSTAEAQNHLWSNIVRSRQTPHFKMQNHTQLKENYNDNKDNSC